MNNGEFTERGLAKKARISQPHLHHILKGKRALRPEVADRLLAELQISILDLL
jgi:plasmid maintenance system antidote protein VapI